MSTATISAIDRLGLTLFFAVSLHVVAILGISFTVEKPEKQPPPDRTIDIMVVQNPKKSEPPKQADYLAQTSQQGGGNEEKKAKPTTRAAQPAPLPAPLPQPRKSPSVAEKKPQPEKPKQVVSQKSPAKKKVVTRPKQKKIEPKKKKKLNATELLASTNLEIERLTAELDKKTRAYAKRPRRKVINANTQEYKYANYLDAWRRKVERIGNLNYPDEAKRRKLYGSLQLHVALNSDGTIRNIRVVRSSGHKLLDDAAIRIVRLAAPYAPFPAEIRKEAQVLDIIRTWQFRHNDRLFSK